jgi:peptide/nickel transport system permease protein
VRAFLQHARYVVGENPVTAAAFALFAALLVVAAVGPWAVPHDPLASDPARALAPPSARYWFGTDQVGRDIFSRVVVATRLDLAISLSAVALSFAAGSLLGACAGYFGGWTDRVVTRVTDTIMAFPLFVLAMGIVAALGNTLANIVYATAVINLPFYARMARAEVNVRREAGFVEAGPSSTRPGCRSSAWACAHPPPSGGSWSPRARRSSSPASGGSPCSRGWR